MEHLAHALFEPESLTTTHYTLGWDGKGHEMSTVVSPCMQGPGWDPSPAAWLGSFSRLPSDLVCDLPRLPVLIM